MGAGVGDETATAAAEILAAQEQIAAALQLATEARERASASADRLERLQRIASALSGMLTPEEVAAVVVREIAPDVGALPLLWLLSEDGTTLELVEPNRHPPAAAFPRIPVDGPLPGAIVARTRRPIYITGAAHRLQEFPDMGPTSANAFVALPLVSHDRLAGVLAVGYSGDHIFEPDERRFLGAVADLAAAAFDRARLRADERRSSDRFQFLAEASALLAASLDYDHTLRRVVRLIVPRVAEMATIHLYDDDGGLRRVALRHQDQAIEQTLLAYVDAHEYEARSAILAAATARATPLLVADTAEIVSHQAAVDLEHARILQNLGITSAILEPLVARGKTLGVLTFLRVGDRPPFGPDDQALARELAGRAAIAVDNARLHAQRIQVATLLQASLLPPKLPDIPGAELAAAYHPAGEGIDAGGDFYDVFALPDDRWAFVIGDVTGTGPAAAALTAQVRHTARAIAGLGTPAAGVVGAVNDLLVQGMDAERFCTIIFATATICGDGVELEVVNGGHPYPIVVHADGSAEVVELSGTLLAIVAGAVYESHRIRLGPGETLILYTDGVIEGRSASADAGGIHGFFDESGLLRAIGASPDRSAAGLVAAIESALRAFAGGHFTDDVAILAVRAAPAGRSW
jgi:serine phosphatase RsbU (regulator of sigma subunit)